MLRPLLKVTPEGLPSEKLLEGDFANLEKTALKQSRRENDPSDSFDASFLDPSSRFTETLPEVGALPKELQFASVILAQTGNFLNADEDIQSSLIQAGIITKPDGSDLASLASYHTSAPTQIQIRGISLSEFFDDLRSGETPDSRQLGFAMATLVRGSSMLLPSEGKSISPKKFLEPTEHKLAAQWPIVSSVGYHKMLVNGSYMMTLDQSVAESLQQEVDTNKRLSAQTREDLERALDVQRDISAWKNALLLTLTRPDSSRDNTELISNIAGYFSDPNLRPFIQELLGLDNVDSNIALFRALERNSQRGVTTPATESIKEQLRIELTNTYSQLEKADIEDYFVTPQALRANEELTSKSITKSLNNLRGIMNTLEASRISIAAPENFQTLRSVENITLSFRNGKSTVPVFDIRIIGDDGMPIELLVAVDTKDLMNSDWNLIENMFLDDVSNPSSAIVAELLGIIGNFEADYESSAIAVRRSRIQEKSGRTAVASTLDKEKTTRPSPAVEKNGNDDKLETPTQSTVTEVTEEEGYRRIRDYMKSLPEGLSKTDRKEAMRQWFEESLLPEVELIVDETWHLRNGADRLHLIGTGYTYIKTVYLKKASENGIIASNVAGGKIAHDDIVRLILLKDQPELFTDVRWKRETNKIIAKALENIRDERDAEQNDTF